MSPAAPIRSSARCRTRAATCIPRQAHPGRSRARGQRGAVAARRGTRPAPLSRSPPMKITAVRVLRLTGTMRDRWAALGGAAGPADRHLSRIPRRATSRAAARSMPTISASTALRPDRDRRRADRHRRPAARHGGRLRGQAPAPDRPRPGPDRARAALGPDAPHHGARPPGRRDAGDQRRRLRAVGPQGPLARPAGVPPARRPDARQRSGLCLDARLRGAGPGPGARARRRIPGAGLSGAEMVLPPRADERPRRHAQECRAGAHAARGARRRLRHHARLLAGVDPTTRSSSPSASPNTGRAGSRNASCRTASTATGA